MGKRSAAAFQLKVHIEEEQTFFFLLVPLLLLLLLSRRTWLKGEKKAPANYKSSQETLKQRKYRGAQRHQRHAKTRPPGIKRGQKRGEAS